MQSRQGITRRQFAQLTWGCLAAGAAISSEKLWSLPAGAALPPWVPGELEIHHIDTGRGNAAFLLGPDGTTLLVDCGASNDAPETSAPVRPNSAHQPGEWVARYALRRARAASRTTLDYAIATHVHPDHIGDVPAGAQPNPDGYIPAGLSQVDALMLIERMIDRSYPDYGLLAPPKAPFTANYLAWLSARRKANRSVERLDVGSASQIHLRDAARFPAFSVRALAANGTVWTGNGTAARSVFPDLSKLPANDLPSENTCSIALKISLGRFYYFTGGDLSADTHDGRAPWLDVETPVVEACGRVEVAVADHHAYFDACGPHFTARLDAQAYVIPAWHMTHPGQAQIERLLAAWPNEKLHDVFTTEMLPANQQLNARWLRQIKSTQGHVVVRVAADGNSYRIFVLDSTTEDERVTASFGPYLCRA